LARYYFDSSALVKLYHNQPGTSVVEQIALQAGSEIVISRLTLVELQSAMVPCGYFLLLVRSLTGVGLKSQRLARERRRNLLPRVGRRIEGGRIAGEELNFV